MTQTGRAPPRSAPDAVESFFARLGRVCGHHLFPDFRRLLNKALPRSDFSTPPLSQSSLPVDQQKRRVAVRQSVIPMAPMLTQVALLPSAVLLSAQLQLKESVSWTVPARRRGKSTLRFHWRPSSAVPHRKHFRRRRGLPRRRREPWDIAAPPSWLMPWRKPNRMRRVPCR